MSGSQPSAMKLATLLIALCIESAVCAALKLLSPPQTIDAWPGESAECRCEFRTEDFSMFENPILWRKQQHREDTALNIMGNILEPFLTTNRFEVTLRLEPPRYQLALRIAQLTQQDSGNYTCEIRGRRSVTLANVTHTISVKAPIQNLRIEVANATTPLLPTESELFHDSSALAASTESGTHHALFIENSPRTIRCVAEGGYPVPSMSVFLGDRDVTSEFQLSQSVSLAGERGLRSILYRTERSCDTLAFTPHDDEQAIRCVATVPGMESNCSRVIVNVIYRPVITCSKASAHLDDRNVHLRCEVRARPPLTALFWIIDPNGTTLTERQIVNGYWTLVMDRSDGVMESQLFLRQVVPQSFRTYKLVAENSVSATTADVELVQRPSLPDLAQADRPRTQSSLHDVHRGDQRPEFSFSSSSAAFASLRTQHHKHFTQLVSSALVACASAAMYLRTRS